jgi:hypothetical protein
LKLEILSVENTNVTLDFIMYYKNGTVYDSQIYVIDVFSGTATFDNTTAEGPSGTVLAANLVEGDPIFFNPTLGTINATFEGTYAGSLREVNRFQTIEENENIIFEKTFTWDKTSGIATALNITSAAEGIQVSLTYTITETNIWQPAPVTLKGDINKDGIVNILDLVKIVLAFSSDPTSQTWNPNCDLNGDSSVNILDLAIAAGHFGEEVRPRENLFMTKFHAWYNVTGYWAEAAFIISNTGGTDVVLDKIAVKAVESSWSNVYYWKTNDITISDDLPVTNVPITGAFNITIQGSARSFSKGSGDIALESGYTMVVYISNPDQAVSFMDVGLSAGLMVFTAHSEFYKETIVQAVQ